MTSAYLKTSVPATYTLIGISCLVSLLTDFGSNFGVLEMVLISAYTLGLPEINSGEWWRVITPTFVHLNIYHLVFNMLWIWVLGSAVEKLQGTTTLLLIFIVTGAASNFAEFYFSGPLFGGMSGVVYGLVGYVWMQKKYNPLFLVVLPNALIPMMLVWYAICWTGLVGGIANMAHTAGLVIGIAGGRLHAKMVVDKINQTRT